jgi:hypothetical protein
VYCCIIFSRKKNKFLIFNGELRASLLHNYLMIYQTRARRKEKNRWIVIFFFLFSKSLSHFGWI